MTRALVTGATGFVGNHLVRVLLERSESVRCMVRDESPRDLLDGLDVELAVADLRDAEAVARAVDGCDVVYHCGADYRLYVPDPDAMYASNVGGTRHVLEAAARHGVERVVYTSTVGALGPVPAKGHYKRSKHAAEQVALEAAQRGQPVVIVNPSAPIGERDIKPTATGKIIVDFLRGKMPAYVDTGLNLVDVVDVAHGHVLAAERGEIGERYVLGNRNMTLREILETLAELTGRRAPRLRLPHWIPMTVAFCSTTWARLTHSEPAVPIDAVRMSRQRMFFDASRAVRELGMPQSPVEGAMQRAIDWFEANGYVR